MLQGQGTARERACTFLLSSTCRGVPVDPRVGTSTLTLYFAMISDSWSWNCEQ